MNESYGWMELYEAAVLETNPNMLPGRIEDAKYAIGQRVIQGAIDEAERRHLPKQILEVATRNSFTEPSLQSITRL